MYTADFHIKSILADQVIDIALLTIELNNVVKTNNCNVPKKFYTRVDSVLAYVHSLFVDYSNNKLNLSQVDEKEIVLMNKLIEYRNSYRFNSYGYQLFNSMYDVIKETFIKYNNI